VSTLEEDRFKEHVHGLDYSADKTIPSGDKGLEIAINTALTSETEPIGGDETRPKNITELYTIKWA